MEISEYQLNVAKTDLGGDLATYALGIAGEAGEVVDIIKKVLEGKIELDAQARSDLAYELGDVMWYIASLSSKLGLNMEGILDQNIRKLYERHGNLTE